MKLSKLIPLGTASIFALTLLVGLSAATAQAGSTVEWKQIIGIIMPGNVVGSGAGEVTGAGQPWSATRGEAGVDLLTGAINFKVEGLVLAGGNNIGTPGNVTEVKGTLVCDTDGSAGMGHSTLVDTDLVPLSAEGDAEFDGEVGPLPDACINEPDIAFLIRIPAGRWIANGAVRVVEMAEVEEMEME
ncbi:MAG: hypothetical protein HYS70_04675 [Nitrospinae bacterium]|nr:hypothetical protein [Nitrospinota bacterium]